MLGEATLSSWELRCWDIVLGQPDTDTRLPLQALNINPRKRLFNSMLGSGNTRPAVKRIYKDRELNLKSTATGDTQGCLCQTKGSVG